MAKRLLLLNGVAILCVILFHAAGFGFTAMFSWAHRYRPVVSPNYDEVGTPAYYALRLIEQLVVFAIPSFLFVSGYFVAVLTGRTRATVDPRAIGARIRSLLIPYLIWSTIALLGFALQGRIFSGQRYLSAYLTGSANPNYYYVVLLVQLYLLAPGIVLLARRRWQALLVATGILQVGVYLLQYPIVLGIEVPVISAIAAAVPKWLFVAHLFWFAFGVVAGFQHQALRSGLERVRWMLPAAAALLFVAGVVEWELLLRWSAHPWSEIRITLVDGLYSAAMILGFLGWQDLELPFPGTLVMLGTRSFGIYLVHGLAMEYFSRGLYHLAPWVLGHQLLFQPLLIAVGLAVPLVLMAAVNRIPIKGLYAQLFG